MKKTYFFLFVLALLAFSCSKDSPFNNFYGPDQLHNNEACKVFGNVIKVSPGPDDTKALIDAFAQAKMLGRNAVVKLMPGVFNISWTEIHEFYGTFTGSGKGVSIITNLPELDPEELTSLDKLPALIAFIGGDVTVSNMSVKLTEMPWLGNEEMNMFLFSDYTVDFVPLIKRINVNLNNIEVTGLLRHDVELYPGGPVTDVPYNYAKGILFTPDKKFETTAISRSNINITVTNCSITFFDFGIYVHGCSSGNLNFGTMGKNSFTGNGCGLRVNENLGVNVMIVRNVFNTPKYFGNCLDLNLGEEAYFGYKQYEDSNVPPGTYCVMYNTFNVDGGIAMGMMDTWRMVHPDNPTWMKILIQDNTYNLSGRGNVIDFYCHKNVLFLNNRINGDGTMAGFFVENFWWKPTTESNISEGIKIVNTLTSNVTIDFWFWCANNCLLMGDLSNFVINDYGENNKIIDYSKNKHVIGKKSENNLMNNFNQQAQKRMDMMFKTYKE